MTGRLTNCSNNPDWGVRVFHSLPKIVLHPFYLN
ncbi:hypothetical protein VPH1254_0034 [Vibrio phage 1254]